MTALINLQTSNGKFTLSDELWDGSVLDIYVGKLGKVKSRCPTSVTLDLWITALAMKIMELKMDEIKGLWELVAEKSKKYLINQLMKNEDQYNILLHEAEKYIMNS